MQYHKPVLLHETIELLVTSKDGIYVDATAGFGGHTREILSRLDDKGRLVGIDRDIAAINYLSGSFTDSRLSLLKGNFSELANLLASLNIKEIDGIVFDLGTSLFQFKELTRGFSFTSDSMIDMRMDTSQKLNGWDIVNRYPLKELERIFWNYGEEPASAKIAKAIVEQRKQKTINTCRELAELIEKISKRRGKIHPATKIFQAIRIEVNDELGELRKGLSAATYSLKSGGKICVISYHSLEDRIVKDFFRKGESSHQFKILTKKPIRPSKNELKSNPSSRSAKLRGAEKT